MQGGGSGGNALSGKTLSVTRSYPEPRQVLSALKPVLLPPSSRQAGQVFP